MANENWKEFESLSKLDFVIHGVGSNEPAKIYANSRNMVEIIVTVEIKTKNKQKLNVTDNEIGKQLYFCNFATGVELGSPWLVSDEPSEYTLAVSDRSKKPPNASEIFIYKYISCSTSEMSTITERFSVGINIPGVGKFDTTQNGVTENWRRPKSLEITAVRQIDYGVHDNVVITSEKLELVSDNLEWESRWNGIEVIIVPHKDGICKRGITYIRPNINLTGQNKFKKHEIVYDPIRTHDVSTGEIQWKRDGIFEPTFSLLKDDGAAPCAVIGRGTGSIYDLNLWFSRQNGFMLNGNFYMEDSTYHYRMTANLWENHIGDDEEGAVTLLLYKFTYGANGKQFKWKNVVKSTTVKVTDYHGNEGTLRLAFNDGENFDKPGLL